MKYVDPQSYLSTIRQLWKHKKESGMMVLYDIVFLLCFLLLGQLTTLVPAPTYTVAVLVLTLYTIVLLIVYSYLQFQILGELRALHPTSKPASFSVRFVVGNGVMTTFFGLMFVLAVFLLHAILLPEQVSIGVFVLTLFILTIAFFVLIPAQVLLTHAETFAALIPSLWNTFGAHRKPALYLTLWTTVTAVSFFLAYVLLYLFIAWFGEIVVRAFADQPSAQDLMVVISGVVVKAVLFLVTAVVYFLLFIARAFWVETWTQKI
ncbi:hypothetical protein HZB02_07115 [Candidatus Woesearchaeota archaeon]|nr:hypothetical protein [Candidatus Woesearchaeota archaeon]